MHKTAVALLVILTATGCGAPLQTVKSGKTKAAKKKLIHEAHQWEELSAPERDKLLREYGDCLFDSGGISTSQRCKKVEWILDGWGWAKEVRPRVAKKVPWKRTCLKDFPGCPMHKRINWLLSHLEKPADIDNAVIATHTSIGLLEWCRGWYHLERKLWGNLVFHASPSARRNLTSWWNDSSTPWPSPKPNWGLHNQALNTLLALLFVKRHPSHFCNEKEVKGWARTAKKLVKRASPRGDPDFFPNYGLAQAAWIHHEFLKNDGPNQEANQIYQELMKKGRYEMATRVACMFDLEKRFQQSAAIGLTDVNRPGWSNWLRRARAERKKTGSCQNAGWERSLGRAEKPPKIDPQSVHVLPLRLDALKGVK